MKSLAIVCLLCLACQTRAEQNFGIDPAAIKVAAPALPHIPEEVHNLLKKLDGDLGQTAKDLAIVDTVWRCCVGAALVALGLAVFSLSRRK